MKCSRESCLNLSHEQAHLTISLEFHWQENCLGLGQVGVFGGWGACSFLLCFSERKCRIMEKTENRKNKVVSH